MMMMMMMVMMTTMMMMMMMGRILFNKQITTKHGFGRLKEHTPDPLDRRVLRKDASLLPPVKVTVDVHAAKDLAPREAGILTMVKR